MKSFKLFFLFLLGALHLNLSAQNNPNFYLHSNGVTCMCPNAAVGEKGTVNGVTYTKRTRSQITEENASTTCTSGIEDMSSMFRESTFNEDISSWDTSNVYSMSWMFTNKSTFNKDISSWDTSNVNSMEGMFYNASKFNQPIGKWDVSNVGNMRSMFYNASKFNQPIENWNVSKNISMFEMFLWASSFNQPIGKWDVSKVTDMQDMFYGATSFNQPIGNWDVSNVTNMNGMFGLASLFNQPIGNWNMSNVVNMSSMFNKATSFNQPIGNWNVSNLTTIVNPLGTFTNADSMFYNALNFNQDISKWCASKIASTPRDFSIGSPLQESFKPKWGAECTALSNSEFTNVSTQLTISPNPFTSSVKINLLENTQANQIQVLNAIGQTVYTSTETELNLEHLPAGMYFVKVNTNQGSATEKIIKN